MYINILILMGEILMGEIGKARSEKNLPQGREMPEPGQGNYQLRKP